MKNLMIRLRIGEKIGIGFGIVGLLFLGVIWQYHNTLNHSLSDYRDLQTFQGARKDRLLAINNELLQARVAEKLFRSDRDLLQAQRVIEHFNNAQLESSSLSKIDGHSARLSKVFEGHLQDYMMHFQAVVDAWNIKGLDENSGLQGSFREAAHELEGMASGLNTDNLYLNLLQIRRGEKDLGLRRESRHQQQVYLLIGQFEVNVQQSQLLPQVKKKLLGEITNYRDEFTDYAETALQGGDLQGGKGPFRDAAHRVEELINQYYVPDLERDILQLRRREKDYLLRADEQYAEMAVKQLEAIDLRIQSAGISNQNREHLTKLLQRYRDDFLSLVNQDRNISALTVQMEQAANEIVGLVKTSVQTENSAMEDLTQSINATSQQRIEWMYWIIIAAIGLGIFFTTKITGHIVKPMRRMERLLEQLTYTDFVEHVDHVEGGRDEVNAMAGFINTLADHRNRFIKWWKNSMEEDESCRQLQKVIENYSQQDSNVTTEINNIKAELQDTMSVKKVLISKEFEEVEKLTEKILNASSLLQHPSVSRGDVDEQGKAIHYFAELIRKSLQMLTYQMASRT